MHSKPEPEHAWLQKLLGDWTTEMESRMGPDQPLETFRGTETVRSLGGLWVICEGQGVMPGGGTAETVISLGYDAAKKKYVGTFLGSMTPHLWLYEGELDSTGKALTLESEGPSCMEEGSMSLYRDQITFLSDDHRTLSSSMPDAEGNWQTFMTVHYRRVGTK